MDTKTVPIDMVLAEHMYMVVLIPTTNRRNATNNG
jgi:hypothetical protein